MKKKRKKRIAVMSLFVLEAVIAVIIILTFSGVLKKRKVIKNPDMIDKLTSASLDHSAWIREGKLFLAGEEYENQDATKDWRDLQQVAISDDHVVALDAYGDVHAAGSDSSLQCRIDGLKKVSYIAAGMQCSLAVMEDGTIQVFGVMDETIRKSLEEEENVRTVAIGDLHTVVLHTDGTVSAYGDNDSGQCEVSQWNDIQQVDTGYAYTAGLTTDGTIVFAGAENCNPREFTQWKRITEIAAGNSFLVARDESGETYATGENKQGECNVNAWKNMISIAAGYDHTIGICDTGEIFATGYNGKGQCNIK